MTDPDVLARMLERDIDLDGLFAVRLRRLAKGDSADFADYVIGHMCMIAEAYADARGTDAAVAALKLVTGRVRGQDTRKAGTKIRAVRPAQIRKAGTH